MVTSIKIFKDNLIFGSGPNTFRFLCSDNRYYVKQNSCSTHPHNYYLQLLSEVGIILPVIFLIIFCLVSLKILKLILFKKTDQDFQEYLILLHIFIILFPLSPNGNFFNNWLNISNFLPFGFYIYYLKKLRKLRKYILYPKLFILVVTFLLTLTFVHGDALHIHNLLRIIKHKFLLINFFKLFWFINFFFKRIYIWPKTLFRMIFLKIF